MHNVIMEGRKNLTLSGIKDCKNFEDNTVLLESEQGFMTIKGEDLKINSFSVETGDLTLSGKIYLIAYKDDTATSGFLKRLFK